MVDTHLCKLRDTPSARFYRSINSLKVGITNAPGRDNFSKGEIRAGYFCTAAKGLRAEEMSDSGRTPPNRFIFWADPFILFQCFLCSEVDGGK